MVKYLLQTQLNLHDFLSNLQTVPLEWSVSGHWSLLSFAKKVNRTIQYLFVH